MAFNLHSIFYSSSKTLLGLFKLHCRAKSIWTKGSELYPACVRSQLLLSQNDPGLGWITVCCWQLRHYYSKLQREHLIKNLCFDWVCRLTSPSYIWNSSSASREHEYSCRCKPFRLIIHEILQSFLLWMHRIFLVHWLRYSFRLRQYDVL